MPARLTGRPARDDLLNIYVLIGLEQPAAARNVILIAFESKVELLRSQPRMGVRRSDIRGSMQMLVEFPYLILYSTAHDTDKGPVNEVQIVRILDGRRELSHLFG